jgi:hypothetical protein
MRKNILNNEANDTLLEIAKKTKSPKKKATAIRQFWHVLSV